MDDYSFRLIFYVLWMQYLHDMGAQTLTIMSPESIDSGMFDKVQRQKVFFIQVWLVSYVLSHVTEKQIGTV